MTEADRFFSKKVEFIRGVTNYSQLPEISYPEIAFAGRSNVGKSSIINAIFNNNNIAKVSNTPGRTQQLNFFQLDPDLIFVDLPGYGYAKAPKKDVSQWNKLINDYLKGRPSLKRVCLLVDARHGIRDNDIEVMKLLDAVAVSYQLILTKIDKISAQELAQRLLDIQQNHTKKRAALHPKIITTSSKDKSGISELRKEIASFSHFFNERNNDNE